MDLEPCIDACLDDIVELLFTLDWLPLESEDLRRFLAAVHRIISRRMEQAQEVQLEEVHRQMARMLECERGRQMRRLAMASKS